jgi:DNA-directed RNA polymerase specialized sigma24 family protein
MYIKERTRMPKAKPEVGFAELHTQLRIISRLLAAQLKTTVGQQEMVRLLATTGASYAEIADVLDTTAPTIATTIQRLKKKNKGQEISSAAASSSQPAAESA